VLIVLIKLIKNFNLENPYSKPRCHVVSRAFSISKNTTAVDVLLLKFKITWSVKPYTFKCRAVTGTETKVACVKYASFFNVPLDYFHNNFLE
jgi:hypothetical protein